MHSLRRILIPVVIILALAALGIWYYFQAWEGGENAALEASGTVEAVEVAVAPETAGRVVEVLVEEGDRVQAGEVLFRLDDELLQAQRQRAAAGLESAQAVQANAQAALELARAALETARAGVEAAQVQVEMAVKAARAAELPARSQAWEEDLPAEFTQPAWYFRKTEEIQAADAEMTAARQALDAERANYEQALRETGTADLPNAEKRLVEAQAAFLVAQEVLDRAEAQPDSEIREYAQRIFDATRSELDAAQAAFDRLLSSDAASELREARARLAVAEERYETARDRKDGLLTGDDDLQVRAAQAALQQAESVAVQAEAGVRQAESALEATGKTVAQAQAEVDWIDVQINKLTVLSAASGVVTARNLEPGEVVQPGATVLSISQLDRVNITVYLPEDRYGQVSLGQRAQVTVDSFPGEAITGTVVRIADRAQYTPRNVQTEEGRRTTVFAVEISVDNSQGKLKPGMPADVRF